MEDIRGAASRQCKAAHSPLFLTRHFAHLSLIFTAEYRVLLSSASFVIVLFLLCSCIHSLPVLPSASLSPNQPRTNPEQRTTQNYSSRAQCKQRPAASPSTIDCPSDYNSHGSSQVIWSFGFGSIPIGQRSPLVKPDTLPSSSNAEHLLST